MNLLVFLRAPTIFGIRIFFVPKKSLPVFFLSPGKLSPLEKEYNG